MGDCFVIPAINVEKEEPKGSGIIGNGVIAPSALPRGSFWILAQKKKKKKDINGPGCNFSDIIGIMG